MEKSVREMSSAMRKTKCKTGLMAVLAMTSVMMSCSEKIKCDFQPGDGKTVPVTMRIASLEQIPFSQVTGGTKANASPAGICNKVNFAVYTEKDGAFTRVNQINQDAGSQDFGVVTLNLAEGSYKLLALINLSSVFTSLTLLGTGILQGINAAKLAAYIIVFGVVVKIIANVSMISAYGLDGAAYATLLVYVLIFIANTLFIFRRIKFTFLNCAILKMILASIIMAAIVGIPTLMMDVADWSRLAALGYCALGAIVGALVYFVILLATKAINKEDLRKLPVIGKRI